MDVDAKSPEFLSKILKKNVVSVESQVLTEEEGGMSGAVLTRLVLKMDKGEEFSLILKERRDNLESSIQLGLAREAFVMPYLKKAFEGHIPKIYHAFGSMKTGEKIILMEDLVQSGAVNSSSCFPNFVKNKGKDIETRISVEDLVRVSFTAAAHLHASFWRFKPEPWLRTSSWVPTIESKLGIHQFLQLTKLFQDSWAQNKTMMENNKSKVQWDPLVIKALDASMKKISVKQYKEENAKRPWTLVHGDFHPSNIFVRLQNADPSIVYVDFEMVGLGSGPQELGQYMISHCEPKLRKSIERKAVESYYKELCAANPRVDMSWDLCWSEYVNGGIGRWLWFLPILATMLDAEVMQYFHDQVKCFLQDHFEDAEKVPMPRI